MSFFLRHEKLVIAFITLLFCGQFFSNRFFTTLDSSAHLYNVELLQHMFFNSHDTISDYYEFNSEFVPNWTGHVILFALKLIFNGEVAEKIFLSAYLFFSVFGLRYLITAFHKENAYLALAGIPFALNVFLFYGFYNFSIATVILLYGLGFWQRNFTNENTKSYLIMACLAILIYASHLFVFLLFLFLIALHVIIHVQGINKESLKLFFAKSGKLLLSFSIPISLFLFYFFKRSSTSVYGYLPKNEIVDYVMHFQALVVYDIKEYFFTDFIVIIMAIALVVLLILNFTKGTWKNALLYLVAPFFLFAVLFYLPDNDGKGGFVILRTLFLAYLLLLIWLFSQQWKILYQFIVVACFLTLSIALTRMKAPTQELFSKMGSQIQSSSEFVQQNEVVLPVWKSAPWDWISAHYSNYLGIDKPMVILENYEAVQDYFPLLWKEMSPTLPLQASSSNAYCEFIERNGAHEMDKINHILVYGLEINTINSCDSALNTMISDKYELKYDASYCRLYSLRK